MRTVYVLCLIASGPDEAMLDTLGAAADAYYDAGEGLGVLAQAIDSTIHGKQQIVGSAARWALALISAHAEGWKSISTLTPREQEAMELIADGATNPDIAETLGIALYTAQKHAAHAIHKLNARNRTSAAAIFAAAKARQATLANTWCDTNHAASPGVRVAPPTFCRRSR